MKKNNINPTANSPRLWPGIILGILIILVRYILPVVDPTQMVTSFMGGVALGILTFIWWLFFSRVAWTDRLIGVGLAIAALVVTFLLVDDSIARANMGMMFWLFSIPLLSIAFIAWAVITKSFDIKIRRLSMVVTILIATSAWTCLRTNGMNGNGRQFFDWRWASTYEDRVMAEKELPGENGEKAGSSVTEAFWPGFRGANRDGIAHGIKIKTDWSKPPEELWRKDVGPGCGSFSVMGDNIFTQEQRGEDEAVSCYDLKTGKLVWMHSDKARFYEPHAGAGPRATPTLSGNKIYTLGATGILNALDATNGKALWTRNAASDTGEKIPGWGFCGSPLVYNDVVIVGLAGRLAAYDIADGKARWTGSDGGSECYSSPQLFNVTGKDQIVFMSDSGAVSVEPETGKIL